jgi:PAS domain S-box-containing protein
MPMTIQPSQPQAQRAAEPPHAERIRQRGERQLAEAQQIAQLGSWEWDVHSQAMIWSDELFRIVGVAPQEVEPTLSHFADAVHPEDRPIVERRIAAGVRRPSCLDFEYRIVRPDGSVRSIHSRAEVLVDDQGCATRMIGTAHDVTELRRFASSITSQVEQLQQLGQASFGIYSAEGVDEILEIATGQAMRILGARRARGSIEGRADSRRRVVELESGSGMAGELPELLAMLEPLARPLRIGAADADRYPSFQQLGTAEREAVRTGWLAVPLVDLVGGATGAIELFEASRGDFTDADEAILVQIAQMASLAMQKANLFDELQVSEDRYRRLFEAHLSGDFVCGVDGELLEVNPALARILGYDSPDALRRVGLGSLYREPGRRLEMIESIRRERRSLQFETEFVRADGATICVLVNLVGVFDRQGELTALQGCLFDVTEWKRAEAALRESQQQLLQAQKMEAVGQLAGGIAHDFNNMLMAIQGFANLLEGELPPTKTARNHLGEIRRAADRSARLTRQLLAYSRKQVLQPEVLDLNRAVLGIEDMLRRLIGEHIAFATVLDPETGRVHADPGQLQQVLMNLVLNARDAMPAGGRLTVRTGLARVTVATDLGGFVLPPGEYATLTVTDTGCGIHPDVLPRIFEPFFTTKAVGAGSGLGLSTAYGIVKQSGGFIRAESEVEAGTSLTLYLPRSGVATSPAPPDPAANPEGGGVATVLVAEDESVLRTLAGIVLRRSGFRVLEAEDGVAALELAEENGFEIDVLVTDLVMPRLGGHPLAERMQQRRPGLRVVFMSGYAEEAVARQGLLADGATFLAKPFPPAVLVNAVREILAPRPLAALSG